MLAVVLVGLCCGEKVPMRTYHIAQSTDHHAHGSASAVPGSVARLLALSRPRVTRLRARCLFADKYFVEFTVAKLKTGRSG